MRSQTRAALIETLDTDESSDLRRDRHRREKQFIKRWSSASSFLCFLLPAPLTRPTPTRLFFPFSLWPSSQKHTQKPPHTIHRPLAPHQLRSSASAKRKKIVSREEGEGGGEKKIIKGNNGALMAGSQAWKAHREAEWVDSKGDEEK
jgi:hypothetical protein